MKMIGERCPFAKDAMAIVTPSEEKAEKSGSQVLPSEDVAFGYERTCAGADASCTYPVIGLDRCSSHAFSIASSGP
jgi:hypothetical protein